jgi:ribosomal protein S18 acetylase RimI-like enzyme
MPPFSVRPMEPADDESGAESLAWAFRNNPGFVAIMRGNEEERVRKLKHFAPALFSAYRERGRAYVAVDQNGVGGLMLSLPPGRYPLSFAQSLTLAQSALAGAGFLTFTRLARVDGFLMKHHIKRNHHYVYMLATHPDRQGQGLGSALLAAFARDAAGAECYLETDDPKNLPFYERRGYSVVHQAESPVGFRVWFLSTHPELHPAR